jgi:hypothetical protein
LRNLWKYYPNNKGISKGILLCGYGLSAIILNKISNFIINPDQVKIDKITFLYPDYIGYRVPKYFLLTSIIMILLGLFASLFIFDYEEDEEDKNKKYKEREIENLLSIENNLIINLNVIKLNQINLIIIINIIFFLFTSYLKKG